MGPIASTPASDLPRRRWVALLALPLAVSIVRYAVEAAPSPPAARLPARIATAAEAPTVMSLDEVAYAHRLWVADHGPGCARTVSHLTPYIGPRLDRWGQLLHLECERRSMGRTIIVRVVSRGPDGLAGTHDDVTGMDVQTID
jgi:hypothetical protein